MMVVVLLFICTCTYLRLNIGFLRSFMDKSKEGSPPARLTRSVPGLLWKAARIGERASLWVSLACIGLGVSTLLWRN